MAASLGHSIKQVACLLEAMIVELKQNLRIILCEFLDMGSRE